MRRSAWNVVTAMTFRSVPEPSASHELPRARISPLGLCFTLDSTSKLSELPLNRKEE